ncbi:MAG: hypothetical protein ACJA0W_003366, partial [Candidatus Azotimanducaceae bacterium]
EADQSIDEFKHSINESIDTTKIDTAKIDVTKPSQASEGEIDESQPASTNGSTVLKTVQNTNDDKTKQ